MKTTLTGVNELIMTILLLLDDKDLINMCKVNKEIKIVCDNNYFWYLRIQQLYPELPIPVEEKEDLKSFYFNINNIDALINYAININYKDILHWLIIYHFDDYKNIFIKIVKDLLKNIEDLNFQDEKVRIAINLFEFLLINKEFLYSDKSNFKKAVYNKINEFIIEHPQYKKLFNYYLNNLF